MRLRRDEWMIGLAVLLLLVVLNGLLIAKYDALLSVVSSDYTNLLTYNYHVSGFDATTYDVLTAWGMKYDVLRHPLLPYLMYLPYAVNQLFISMTGVNGALYIAAVIILCCGFLSAVLLYRILHELVGVRRSDAAMLTLLFFSLAYTLVTHLATDHFALSLFLILLSVWLIGKATKEGRVLRTWQTALLVLATSGVTLTNGAKVCAAELVARGRGFFRWRFLVVGVLLPAILMVGLGLLEERIYVYPKEQAEKKYFREHRAEVLKKRRADHIRYKNAPWVVHKGKPLGKGSLMRWTDTTTSRWESLVENVFGESIQLHEDYVLDDILKSSRPVLLTYRYWWDYVVEAVVVLLFLVGIWCGRRSRLLWMCLLGIVPDIVMHLVLGFAINEVYIMSAHWLYVIPIAMAYLVKSPLLGRGMRWVLWALCLYLLVRHCYLLVEWMREPIVSTAFWFE